MLAPPDTDGLAFLQVVADPHRWRLLHELGRSDRRVNELTALLDQPQNLVSYHLRQLRDAGLVASRRSSADRRDTYYRADLTRLAEQMRAAGEGLHPGLQLGGGLGGGPAALLSVRTGRRLRVLFLCTGNSARSQMAQALLEHRTGGAVEARSAGSHPKALHPHAVRVLAERGIDISGRSTTHLRSFARTHFTAVVTLCDRVREVCPEFPRHPTLVHWSIPDPALEGGTDEESTAAFVRTADELEVRIPHLVALLTSRPDDPDTRPDDPGTRRRGDTP